MAEWSQTGNIEKAIAIELVKSEEQEGTWELFIKAGFSLQEWKESANIPSSYRLKRGQ